MFKGFKAYNWILYLIGIGYVILALLDAKENLKQPIEVGEAFQECLIVVPATTSVDPDSDIDPGVVANIDDFRVKKKGKDHEPA